MELKEILSRVDHTLLRQDASWEEIRTVVDEGIAFGTASVCLAPSRVREAAEYAAGRVKICTVIGFPNGYSTTEVKCFEASDAVKNGADEIDMVINLGWVKDGAFEKVLREIDEVKAFCGAKILKVIIETSLLTGDEKVVLCEVVSKSKAEFIKTSTGFADGGATFADVELMSRHCAAELKIKAAGGISSLSDAEEFLRLGADRLGTSRMVALAKQAGR